MREVQKGGDTCVHMADSLHCIAEPRFQSLGQEDPLEKGMATHSSIVAWRIPWTEDLAA